MANELYTRELKAETLVVKSIQHLVSIEVTDLQVIGVYRETKLLKDDTELTSNTFRVVRSRKQLDQAATDLVTQWAQFIEGWRQEDEQLKAEEVASPVVKVGP